VAVVGRRTAVRVFEPVFAADLADRQAGWEKFAAALAEFYAGRFPAAREQFAALQDRDPPAAAYVRKCQALIDHPPAIWDGVWEMTEK